MKYYGDFGKSVELVILEQQRRGIDNIAIVLSYDDWYNWLNYLCNTNIGVLKFQLSANNHTFQYMGKTIIWSYGVIDEQIKTVI
jgi:trans-2-enoyl-CoA reductase